MEVLSLIIYTKYFWDFDMWPFNRVWPLNGGPLNGGSTVLVQLYLELDSIFSRSILTIHAFMTMLK